MLIAIIFFCILILIAILGALALCKISAPNDEERILEDEEQMEYLRKFREKEMKRKMCVGAKKSGACPGECEICAWNVNKEWY